MKDPKKPAAAAKNSKAKAKAKAKAKETGIDESQAAAEPQAVAETSDGRSTPAESQETNLEESQAASSAEAEDTSNAAETDSPVETGDDGPAAPLDILETIVANIKTAVAEKKITKAAANRAVKALSNEEITGDFVTIRVPIANLKRDGFNVSQNKLPQKLKEQRLNLDQRRGLGRICAALLDKGKLKNGEKITSKERVIRYLLDLVNDELPS